MSPQLQPRRRRRKPARLAGGIAASIAAHAAIALAIVATWTHQPLAAEPAPIAVTLIDMPRPAPPRPQAAAPAPPRPQPAFHARQPKPAPADVPTFARSVAPSSMPGIGDGELASGAGAGGGQGGACDMAGRLQSALRKDQLVQAELAQADHAGGAIVVWNGDWVRSPREDGKGLAAVREAITWEVAFAPPACRTEPMRGLVLLAASPASPRLAVGSAAWHWSDLLIAR